MLNSIVHDFLSNFDPGTHVVLFYDTTESKRNLLFTHLKYGENSQGLTYVCSEESPEQIRQGLLDFGMDTYAARDMNKLTITNYDDVYIVNGQVNVSTIIRKFAGMVDSYRNRGYNGMRAAAEMSCFFKHEKVDELIEYEKALHRKFAFKAEGICAYNISEICKLGYIDMLMPLVRAHDPVIFASPNGYLIMKPEKVRHKHIEEITNRIPN